MMQKKLRKWFAGPSAALGAFFGKLAPPNVYTFLTLVLGLLGGFYLATNQLVLAVILIFLSGAMDLIDGAVAKATGKSTVFGAVFDSVTDTITEAFVYLGFYFGFESFRLPALLALSGFLLAAYTYMRICKEGKEPRGFVLLERKERLFLILIAIWGITANNPFTVYGLYLIAAWSFLAVFLMLRSAHRIFNE